MLSQSAPQGFLGGRRWGSAAVCDPNPPRPFARCRLVSEIRFCFESVRSDLSWKFVAFSFVIGLFTYDWVFFTHSCSSLLTVDCFVF